MSQSPASSSMSKTPPMTASCSNIKVIFEKALKAYQKTTKQDLTVHPLAIQLQTCDSPTAILTILQDQVHQFEQSRSGDERLRRWLNPTINVLYAFSATLGEGVGLVFSPAKALFAGAGVLLLAAKDVEASQDLLIDVFERIENFFRRLEIYTQVPPTPAMTDMMVKIMVEVLDILGTATKEMKQSRAKRFLKKVAGIRKLEDGLIKLDKMTNEEARMANAEMLRVAHNIDEKVQGVGIQVQDVDVRVQGVNKDVQGVSVQVQSVDENVIVVGEMVQNVIDDGKGAKLMMRQIAYNVDDVNRRQMRESLRKWQSPSDPSTNHNIACDLQHEGTAEWFCDGNIFEEWEATGSLLWIHGKPGSGKSVLCSAIIQKTAALYEAGLASMAYFYFDFRDVDKRSRRNLLPSLLLQLSARSDPFCDILSRLYKAHDDGARQPSDSALIRCLKDMLTLPDQGPVYLILDALDECPKTSGVPSIRQQVLDLVKDLVGLGLPSLHICVTSRPEVDIQDALESVASHSVSLHDESGQQKDIAEYVESVVHSNSVRSIRRWRDADKDLVIKTLSERADGMFRWVFCQLETLQHCLPQNIPRALSELPASLDETYERMLKEIATANRHHTYRLLQCLTVASRPLLVEELAEMLALDFDGVKEGLPELKEDWRWKDQQEAVLSTCSSLIVIVGDDRHRVVQFSHFSVKEFLTSDRLALSSADISQFHIPPEPAHTVVSKACLGILLQSDNGVGGANVKSSSPLAKYAAAHWVDHAQVEQVSTSIEDGMRRLFDLARPHFAAWLKLHDIDTDTIWDNLTGYGNTIRRGSPLYYASLCGFHDLAAHLIDEHPQHVNARLGQNGSPLAAALCNKHFHIAELLHQRGANVGFRNDGNHTLLHAASTNGFVDIAEWLLAHGGDANSREDNRETPLHLAAKNGQIELVRMLLRHGNIIVNAKNRENRTSLHMASDGGHAEIVRLLLEHGADVTTRDLKHNTSLHLASTWNDINFYYRERSSGAMARTVQVLLEHGADVTARDDTRSTPLHLASSKGFPDISRLLIEHGADVNALDGKHNMPLHLASSWYDSYSLEYLIGRSKAKAETVKVLLEHGADMTARDDAHTTPLHLAMLGWSPMNLRLLNGGTALNTLDEDRKTPLYLALPKGSLEIMRLLIEHGADVTGRDDTHSTPLHLASSMGSPEIARLLIENGADVNALDENSKTPLHLASSWDDSYSLAYLEGKSSLKAETVKVLLEHGADMTARDDTYSTPLHLASSEGSPETSQILIEHGADVNALDENRKTPLHLASYGNDRYSLVYHEGRSDPKAESVYVLLKRGADVTARDDTHTTPLHLASSEGYPEISRLLIEHGADVNALDENRKTPLHLASSRHRKTPLHLASSRNRKIPSHMVSSWDDSYLEYREMMSIPKGESVKVLLEHGADVTARDDTHSTPLHLASSMGSPKDLQLLIEHGAAVNTLDWNRKTPLHLASSRDDSYSLAYYERESNPKAENVKVLLKHGADVTARDDTHTTPLHLASSMGSPEISRLLIEHGADVNALDEHSKTPLHLASSHDNRYPTYHKKESDPMAETVKVLLEHGADVTAQDDTHTTALHLASSMGSPEIVQLLIEYGAAVNALDKNRKTPLLLASSGGDSYSFAYHERKFNPMAETVKVLLKHGADVTARDDTHTTPLHMASSMGSSEIVRLLIEHGADINARDGGDKTPLHFASVRVEGRFPGFLRAEIVQVLIQHGADVTARDKTHSTPSHLASSMGSGDTAKLLIQHEADANAQDGRHSTPLDLAASPHLGLEGNVVRLLLSHDANVSASDDRGRTPFQIASSIGHSGIAELLQDG